ncbi:DUF3876 domain-containing protein [uncultured Alistipes sp.]|uniref:DUF3876 domain-containing protein n=1 Tax=uncultured Alistipes sp. TaxID=538949 RepID=UPI00320B675C
MLQVSKCLIGLAVMMLQSCDVADNRRDMLCGNWESVEGKPDVLIYKEGEAYKVTVFRRSGPAPQAQAGNLSLAGGERQPVHEHRLPHRRVLQRGTDVLTFSPNGDYVRVKPQPGHPTEE